MRSFRVLAYTTFMLALAAVAPVGAARAAGQSESAVQQANDQFYAALNALFKGDTQAMDAAWSHADDVTCLGPDGKFLVGWDQVRQSWDLHAKTMLGGSIRPEDVHATTGEDLATVQCFEVGDNIVDGKPVQVKLRATNIFRKENGQWKMIGHQTDKLPFLEQ